MRWHRALTVKGSLYQTVIANSFPKTHPRSIPQAKPCISNSRWRTYILIAPPDHSSSAFGFLPCALFQCLSKLSFLLNATLLTTQSACLHEILGPSSCLFLKWLSRSFFVANGCASQFVNVQACGRVCVASCFLELLAST